MEAMILKGQMHRSFDCVVAYAPTSLRMTKVKSAGGMRQHWRKADVASYISTHDYIPYNHVRRG